MITYYLSHLYYARLHIGHGLNRQSFYGQGSTRHDAIALALMKAYRAKLIK